MTYASKLADISRTPCTLIEIDLDYCSLTYGTGACTASGASGTECYNTYTTCQDKTNFAKTTKTYQNTSLDTAVPFLGPRPYLDKTTFLATEIKDKLSVKQRVKATFVDEPDADVGTDPYVANRSSVQGTRWKKLLARNPNYKGRPFRQYQGFIGLAENEFEERFAGTIDNITLSKGKVTIEAVDLLSSLSDVTIAAEIEAELNADITATSVSITLTDTDELTESTGYIKLSDEIIYYTAKNDITNTLTTELQYRGMFNTTAATHDEGDSVQPVHYFAPDHPYDHMDTLLTLAEIDSRMNTTAFAYWRDFPGTDIDFSAIIHEPIKASVIFWELVNLTNSVVWQDEEQQISIRKLLANEPGRSYGEINDVEHIVGGSSSADLNDKSRVTRVILYWDRTTLGDEDEVSSYQTIEIAIDADAESANEYNDEIEERLFCRWLRHGYIQDEDVEEYAELLVRRQLMAKRDAQEIVIFKLELKDEGLKTGDSIKLTTDALSKIDGSDLTSQPFMVIKRNPKGNELEYKVKQMPKKLLGFIGQPDGTDIITGVDSDMSFSITNWIGSTMGIFNVDNTVADKMYFQGNGAEDTVKIAGVCTAGKLYWVSLKARLNTSGPSAPLRIGNNIIVEDGFFTITPTAIETTYTGTFVAQSTGSLVVGQITPGFNGIAFEIDDVLLREQVDWADATDDEREYGFICDADGMMDATNEGYHIY